MIVYSVVIQYTLYVVLLYLISVKVQSRKFKDTISHGGGGLTAGSSPLRVNLKDMRMLRTHYYGIGTQIGWLSLRLLCLSKTTCFSVDRCFSEISRQKSNYVLFYYILSSSHRNITLFSPWQV